MTLGNTVPHLHAHVLPRYQDDPAPGGLITWEAIFAADPVPEAELRRQAADLRGLLVPDLERIGAPPAAGWVRARFVSWELRRTGPAETSVPDSR
jgi:hypothetical protein